MDQVFWNHNRALEKQPNTLEVLSWLLSCLNQPAHISPAAKTGNTTFRNKSYMYRQFRKYDLGQTE